jgi:hypothetical protein
MPTDDEVTCVGPYADILGRLFEQMQDSKTTIIAFLTQWNQFFHPIIRLFKNV